MEISKLMRKNVKTKKYFNGVYPCDRLPLYPIKKPAYFIVNTDPANKSGMHWVAIYIPKSGKSEYFDSYGNPPFSKHFVDFMRTHSIGYNFNKKQLQSLFSSYCGNYCCEYVLHRCRGYSLKSFVAKFSKATLKNDVKIIQQFKINFLPSKKKRTLKKKTLTKKR